MLGITVELSPPREVYERGWGKECANPKIVRHTWYLTVLDANKQPTTIPFDIVDGDDDVMIGLDVKEFSDTINRGMPRRITFKRPHDTSERTFYTYIDMDSDNCKRLRLELVPHARSSVASMMSNVVKRPDLNLVKKVHRYTHMTAEEMREFFREAGILTDGLSEAADRVHAACDICTRTGIAVERRKISLTHVNEAFNEEVQADFVTVYIRGEKYEVFNVVDTGTAYGERAIAPSRTAECMQNLFQCEWLYHHGAPRCFSADPEFLWASF